MLSVNLLGLILLNALRLPVWALIPVLPASTLAA